LAAGSHWQYLGVAALTEEIYGHQLALANLVIEFGGVRNPDKVVSSWLDNNRDLVEPTERLLSKLWSTDINVLRMIAVASRSLNTATGGGD
jgi:NAD-specific glutamate dehydrogenase